MENASKALIIAAGVLIGVLILSLAVYLIQSFGGFSQQMNTKMEQTEIAQFNSKFYKFLDRTDISVQDIVTIINYAKENNIKYDIETDTSSPYYMRVLVDNKPMERPSENIDKFLKDTITNNPETTFSCVQKANNMPIVESDITGLVIRISFYKN